MPSKPRKRAPYVIVIRFRGIIYIAELTEEDALQTVNRVRDAAVYKLVPVPATKKKRPAARRK